MVDTFPVCGQDPAAVTARSVLAGAESVLVTGAGPGGTVLDGSPLVLGGGRVGLRVPARAPLAGARKAAAAGRAADVAVHVTALVPVPVRDRVRARLTLSGTLLPWDRVSLPGSDASVVGSALDGGDEVWVLDVQHVVLQSGDDLVSVTPEGWAAAAPDPLSPVEAAHLQHLCARHPEALRCLAGLLDPAVTAGASRVVPVALDSRCLVMRAERDDRDIDVRLPFAAPVVSAEDLRREMRRLIVSVERPGTR